MLKYYAYYSVGGYKDLYLGNSEMDASDTYYLPLLAIERKRAEDEKDEVLKEKVASLDQLPKICLVTKKENYGLPQTCTPLISYGGYKLICLHESGGTHALVLRDIKSTTIDEAGRKIPFLLIIIADTVADSAKLYKIAAYWANHLNTVESTIDSMIGYDATVNGVKFKLKEFNSWINQCSINGPYIKTTKGAAKVECNQPQDSLIILCHGIKFETVTKDLKINPKRCSVINFDIVLPLDNPIQSRKMLDKASQWDLSDKKIIVGVTVGTLVVAAGAIGYFLMKN